MEVSPAVNNFSSDDRYSIVRATVIDGDKTSEFTFEGYKILFLRKGIAILHQGVLREEHYGNNAFEFCYFELTLG